MRDLLRDRVVRQRGLIRVPLLLELHGAEQQHRGHYPEDRVEVLIVHAHDVHRLDGGLELQSVIDAGDR